MRWPEVVYKRRKERQNISAFKGLIDEPTSTIQLPANIELYVRSSSDVSFGTVAISANERDIAVPALAEGQVRHDQWVVPYHGPGGHAGENWTEPEGAEELRIDGVLAPAVDWPDEE